MTVNYTTLSLVVPTLVKVIGKNVIFWGLPWISVQPIYNDTMGKRYFFGD